MMCFLCRPPANRYWAQEKPPEDGPQDDPREGPCLPDGRPAENTDIKRSAMGARHRGHATGSLSVANTMRSNSILHLGQRYSYRGIFFLLFFQYNYYKHLFIYCKVALRTVRISVSQQQQIMFFAFRPKPRPSAPDLYQYANYCA
jgi:hypothetical protein